MLNHILLKTHASSESISFFSPLPQTIWSKNNRPIRFGYHVKQGNYGKSLVFDKILLEDDSVYTCDVSNGVGSIKSHRIKLQVQGIKNSG